MNARRIPQSAYVRIGWVWAGLLLAAGLPLRAAGAERIVLIEEFTATW